MMSQIKEQLLNRLKSEANFRETQIDLLYSLLIKTNRFLYPNIHAYGLSGSGKTFTIRKFIDIFSHLNSDTSNSQNADYNSLQKSKAKRQQQQMLLRNSPKRYFIYFDCLEICHSSMTIVFYQILYKLRSLIQSEMNSSVTATTASADNNIDLIDDLERLQSTFDLSHSDELSASADFSNFIRQFRKYLKYLSEISSSNLNLLIVFDNSDNMKYLNDSSNLLLTLCKLNEYVNADLSMLNVHQIRITNLFISEIDWHSLISDCELMAKTESPRPFIIYFEDYSKEQMLNLVKKMARYLGQVSAEIYEQESNNAAINHGKKKFYLDQIEFYAQIILEVFYPICKDLNEIQYLIQMYYDQLMSTSNFDDEQSAEEIGAGDGDNANQYKKMLKVWKNMQPFLKQALSRIYLRVSNYKFPPNSNEPKTTNNDEQILTKQFQTLNITNANNSDDNQQASFIQLPKVMRILLISAYICTHNPPKLDKKLFDYNSTVKSRRTKITAQKHQQNEEQQRQSALKMQSFDINRLLSIYFSICSENSYDQSQNLNHIQISIQTLRSLNYLQQTNSSFSSLDESKFKCLLDFSSIEKISQSVQFNIKQYLAEFINV